MDWNAEDPDHHREDDESLTETNQSIGDKLADDQAGSTHGRHEELLKRAELTFAHHGEGREEEGDELQDDADETRDEEMRALEVRVVEKPRADLDGEGRATRRAPRRHAGQPLGEGPGDGDRAIEAEEVRAVEGRRRRFSMPAALRAGSQSG